MQLPFSSQGHFKVNINEKNFIEFDPNTFVDPDQDVLNYTIYLNDPLK
jgi:hypothetical protein